MTLALRCRLSHQEESISSVAGVDAELKNPTVPRYGPIGAHAGSHDLSVMAVWMGGRSLCAGTVAKYGPRGPGFG
jgi:hypothetical protein